MSKAKSENKSRVCVKCGKPGANHFVMTGEKTAKGPYHAGCKPSK